MNPRLVILGSDPGGKRDFLEGRPIYCASSLEVFRGDHWETVRYEISDYDSDPMEARLYRDRDTTATAPILDRERDIVRWPERKESA